MSLWRSDLSRLMGVLLVLACCVFIARSSEVDNQPNSSNVRLLLPSVIYAVPRIESNVYFDNVVLVLNRQNYAFDVICDKGVQLAERWTFTPEPQDVGDFPLEIVVRDETNAVLARGKTIIHVAPLEQKVDGLTTLLLVGASLTEYSIYPQQLLDLDKRDGYMRLKLIGSRGPNDAPPTGELRHEGYSGWTAEAFVTLHGPLSRSGYYKRPETGSPFVYEVSPGQYQLDFARYCNEFNSGVGPVAITIHLIPNDVFTATDETIESRVSKMLEFYDILIKEFHRVRRDTRIGVILTAPPSRSQDGFRNYRGAGRQTRWQYRRNYHRALERVMQRYSGRESENIYLVPSYVNFDADHHYPTMTVPANARTSETVVRVNNGTHPSPEGYQQIADSVYCWLKAVTGVETTKSK
jgi:lysophospholipase L1-like esterase